VLAAGDDVADPGLRAFGQDYLPGCIDELEVDQVLTDPAG
jgi:hypothetical protein